MVRFRLLEQVNLEELSYENLKENGLKIAPMGAMKLDGNLLDSNADIIIHQVNCQGAMNSGVAKAIREKWPIVFDKYSKLC